MQSNKTILAFSKVSYVNLLWKNQYDCSSQTKPEKPTLHGRILDPDAKLYKSETTVLESAKARGALDVWTPHCVFALSNNHSVTYTGKKALEMHGAYCGWLFRNKE